MSDDMKELNRDTIAKLALDGLVIDGEHHKQWFLEQIAFECGVGEHTIAAYTDGREGIAP